MKSRTDDYGRFWRSSDHAVYGSLIRWVRTNRRIIAIIALHGLFAMDNRKTGETILNLNIYQTKN